MQQNPPKYSFAEMNETDQQSSKNVQALKVPATSTADAPSTISISFLKFNRI